MYNKITIPEASKTLGFSVGFLSEMENNQKLPSITNLEIILDYYEVNDIYKAQIFDLVGKSLTDKYMQRRNTIQPKVIIKDVFSKMKQYNNQIKENQNDKRTI